LPCSAYSEALYESDGGSEQTLLQPAGEELGQCRNLLSKLQEIVEEKGPPIHLEKGLRLLHSLRSRMIMARTLGPHPNKRLRGTSFNKYPETANRASLDLLFWLALIFDTLSSVMYKRPLVVSLEDSELMLNREATKGATYDEFLFSNQRPRLVRWPSSEKIAHSLLCEAAPIKVLLFRKVTHLQSLLSRGVEGKKIEGVVQVVMQVYEHWQTWYAPFFQEVFVTGSRLSLDLQSWSICMAGQWGLATLLLADLIEMVDNAEASTISQRNQRRSSGFVAAFRQINCRSLSDTARCVCDVDQDALLSEPWTVVLIRAFATAGVYLLEYAATSDDGSCEQEDLFQRVGDCNSALQYLSRKSDMALVTMKMLNEALRSGGR
jgi:hypothetical protein